MKPSFDLRGVFSKIGAAFSQFFSKLKPGPRRGSSPDPGAPANPAALKIGRLRVPGLSKRTFFLGIAALIALVLVGAFIRDHISWVGGFPVYKKNKNEEKKDIQPVEIPPPIKVYKISKVSFRDSLPAFGTIKGFRQVDLKFSTPGVVEYVNFKEGERITQGDIVASLDQKEALLKLEYAKVELDKQSQLLELGSITESKFKQTQLEYQSAKNELEKTNLTALSDGYVGSVEVDKGSYVMPQDIVGTFVDVKDVFVEFGIIEKDVPKVKEGQNVEITVESFPDQIFKGEVESISPLVEGRSRTVRVKSKISNVDEKIKPGMFGRANVLVYEKEDALVIPASSLKKQEEQYFVYLVHSEEKSEASPGGEGAEEESSSLEPAQTGPRTGPGGPPVPGGGEAGSEEEPEQVFGTVEIRNVEIEYATPDAIEIKEGLEEGDQVVVDIEQDLKDKQKVEVTETQEGIF